jgi:hypothetical protein
MQVKGKKNYGYTPISDNKFWNSLIIESAKNTPPLTKTFPSFLNTFITIHYEVSRGMSEYILSPHPHKCRILFGSTYTRTFLQMVDMSLYMWENMSSLYFRAQVFRAFFWESVLETRSLFSNLHCTSGTYFLKQDSHNVCCK